MSLEAKKRSRGEALAEAFFYKMDRELLESLRMRIDRAERVKSFEACTGIRDPRIVEGLVDAGLDLSTITAFLYAPAVFVAWADGQADEREQEAIRLALPQKGVSQDAVACFISHTLFQDPPSKDLWNLWESFSVSFLDSFSPQDRDLLIREIVELCYLVARSSGGVWGMGSISPRETKVIQQVLEALHRRPKHESNVA
jgi:tellurite resistance protein